MKKIAFLGSGDGEIFEAVIRYLKNNNKLELDIICLSNNLNDNILKRAEQLGIKYKYLPFEENLEYFASNDFDLIALDNYSKKIQLKVLETGHFINIHPSLLPAFKGEDAIARAFSSGVKVSGVTVHTLTGEIDGGKIIAQYPVLISNSTHFDEFRDEILKLEQIFYPIVIEKILEDKVFDFSDLINISGCGGNCGGCNKY